MRLAFSCRVLGVLLFVACGASPAPEPVHEAITAPSELDWMLGDWVSCEGGNETRESWSRDGDDLVGEGHARLRDHETGIVRESSESMRIERSGEGWVYWAHPHENGGDEAAGDHGPTRFWLATSGERTASFEAPEHDYPQRIRYDFDGITLEARIETLVGTRSHSWRFRRGTACEPNVQ